ncbi:Uncharacterised protein [Klebsiella pneumoniae]|nr:Uncharacterised protein [Klebsiella pneumoniae]
MFKVNEYFDGTVKSIAFDMTAGPATIWRQANTSSAPASWRSCMWSPAR